MRFSTLFALTGAVQGWLLWWLWRAPLPGQWAADQPVIRTAILYITVTVPLVIYCTQNVERLSVRARLVAVAAYFAAFGLLGAYAAWIAGAQGLQAGQMLVRASDGLAAFVLGLVSLGLLCGFDPQTRRWHYARLFHYAWRNALLLATAAVMTGVVWLVLWAGASLMSLIGVRWIMTLIQKPVFIFPVIGLVSAGAFALALGRASLVDSIRRFWLSITAWLLPLVLFFGVIWVGAVPFTGLKPLFSSQSAALMMLCFAALAVKFANCAYQDGQDSGPYPRWLRLATQAAWLSLMPVVAIACWALGLRIAQYGLSEQRVWAVLVTLLAGIYAVGYALSWRTPGRWMAAIAGTNIVAAVVLCAGLLALLSPLANVHRLAVASHLQRIDQAAGQIEPDWRYLRWQAGRPGAQALQALAAGQGVPSGQPWADKARQALAQRSRSQTAPETVTAQDIFEKIDVRPAGRPLPPGFVLFLQTTEQRWTLKPCVQAMTCLAWVGDLNGDGQDEVVLFRSPQDSGGALYTQTQGSWRQAGRLHASAPDRQVDLSQLDTAQAAPSGWQDLVVSGKRLRTNVND